MPVPCLWWIASELVCMTVTRRLSLVGKNVEGSVAWAVRIAGRLLDHGKVLYDRGMEDIVAWKVQAYWTHAHDVRAFVRVEGAGRV